jgi:hypothetical protein
MPSLSHCWRLIDPTAKSSVSPQAIVPGIRRGGGACKPSLVSDAELALMHRIDKPHRAFPFAGRRMVPRLPDLARARCSGYRL